MDKNQDKRKVAVALGYDSDDEAPRIIASGKGHVADKIIEAAKESKVPLHQDDRLAASLAKVEIGDCIPPELYQVVSEVLVFVDQVDHIKEKLLKHKE